jgi:hypothetical protein
MTRLRHWLAHRLGWNQGHVETFWTIADHRLKVCFRCDGCGEVSDVHEPPRWIIDA